MKEEVMNQFSQEMTVRLNGKFSLRWDIDKKGVVCGWCNLDNPEDIYSVAELVAGLNGRVMAISPLNTPDSIAVHPPGEISGLEKTVNLVVNYHFFFAGMNCTVTLTLPDNQRSVKSITPVLKSADWQEREMRELFNLKVEGHPNSKRLFLDENIYLTDHTMIPLSEAMDGASTTTLWEKIMKSGRKEANTDE